MTRNRRVLLGATAGVALMIGTPAFAFEEVDWTWDATIDQHVTIDIDIDSAIEPTGAIQVEKLQMHFGNLASEAHVNGVYNNPSAPTNGGIASLDETFTFTGVGDQIPDPTEFPETAGVGDGNTNGLVATLIPPSTYNEGDQGFNFTVNVQGDVTVPPGDGITIDAADLPKVSNAATSVANNQSIEANVPIYLHDAQFAAGGFNATCDAEGGDCPDAVGFLLGALGVTAVDGQLEDLNEHTSIAGLMTVAAATGFIEPAEITANASVSNVLNAYVENAATAVTNNASFEVLSDNEDNHYVVADLTQWGYANLSATAGVSNVSINDYTGFGAAGLGGGGEDVTAIVSNAATAVGNNLSIKVGVPGVDG